MDVVFSMPPCFGKGVSNSMSLSLDVLGNLIAVLSPVMREDVKDLEEANDFLKSPVDDLLPREVRLLSLEPTFSRRK
jgi:hypothetical protein